MNITRDRRPLFRHSRAHSNPYRIVVWVVLLVGCLFLLRAVNSGEVKPVFSPTSTPTRTSSSFSQEGETHFTAGDLNLAIAAYKNAVNQDTKNAGLWSELARIQAYSSNLLTTDDDRRKRLAEALDSVNQAVKLEKDNSTATAIRAFVLDWNANPMLAGERSPALLTEAEQEAVRALQLDNQNVLALAYYAEILVDQQKWLQAEQYARQALERDATTMDVHRVMAYVQESLGNYQAAIKEYQEAAKINPNLTFLYISIGANYRQLKLYEQSLEYFAKAASINETLGIKDPIPYLSISKSYSQMGEFFIAGRNVKKALRFNPSGPDVYGQLGIIYFKSKNYESSIPALQCAIYGCEPKQSCEVRECDEATDPQVTIQGMPLSGNTVVYYYTYGSVLAGMHRASNNYCQEAVKVLGEVRDKFGGDTTIMQIVGASEQICASYGFTN